MNCNIAFFHWKKFLCYDSFLYLTYQTCTGSNLIFPYCPDCPNSPKTANPCFISCYVYDKHNINLAVLIFFKTYVWKHESKRERKHIELKPTQKNWPFDLKYIFLMQYAYLCILKYKLLISRQQWGWHRTLADRKRVECYKT